MAILPQHDKATAHPTWCSREACQMPGSLFHTRDEITMGVEDADWPGEIVTTWAAVEAVDDQAPKIRVQLNASEHHQYDRGLALTPAQATALGEALVRAGTWTNGRVG